MYSDPRPSTVPGDNSGACVSEPGLGGHVLEGDFCLDEWVKLLKRMANLNLRAGVVKRGKSLGRLVDLVAIGEAAAHVVAEHDSLGENS